MRKAKLSLVLFVGCLLKGYVCVGGGEGGRGRRPGQKFFRRASGLRMWGALSWGKLSGGVVIECGTSCHLRWGHLSLGEIFVGRVVLGRVVRNSTKACRFHSKYLFKIFIIIPHALACSTINKIAGQSLNVCRLSNFDVYQCVCFAFSRSLSACSLNSEAQKITSRQTNAKS